jgi:hypothetical protein
VQPVTRWAFPYPFLSEVVSAPRDPHTHYKAGEALQPAQLSDDSLECLAALLVADLNKGHRYKAIRHFLMLKGRRAPIAPAIEFRCQQLLQACPLPRKRRIEADVQKWLHMLAPFRTTGHNRQVS